MKYFRNLFFILIAFTPVFMFSQTGEVQDSKNIAVMNLTPRNVSEVEASVVSGRISIALKQTGKFTIIERELMSKLLEEQQLQQTGCIESECMAEVDKLLSVRQIVGGSVSKTGNLYVIEARVFIK